MKAVQAQNLGSITDYAITEVSFPSISDSELLIRIMTCGLGYVDTLVALGQYQVKPPVPFTPGHEVSGVVEAVGAGVLGFEVGDRVMAYSFGGGLAEYVAATQDMVVKIPAAMSFAEAAGFRINYLTAYHGLSDRAAVQPGEIVLVFGAAGGVGTATVQVARLLGAEVIAAASTPEKPEFATQNGAHHCIDTNVDGWRDRIKDACGGTGPDVVFDPVCGPLFEPAFRSLAWRGRHLVVGLAAGAIPSLRANLPLVKGSAMIGVDVNQFQNFELEEVRACLGELLKSVESGALKAPSGKKFAFDEFAQAMAFAMSGAGPGRAVVHIAVH